MLGSKLTKAGYRVHMGSSWVTTLAQYVWVPGSDFPPWKQLNKNTTNFHILSTEEYKVHDIIDNVFMLTDFWVIEGRVLRHTIRIHHIGTLKTIFILRPLGKAGGESGISGWERTTQKHGPMERLERSQRWNGRSGVRVESGNGTTDWRLNVGLNAFQTEAWWSLDVASSRWRWLEWCLRTLQLWFLQHLLLKRLSKGHKQCYLEYFLREYTLKDMRVFLLKKSPHFVFSYDFPVSGTQAGHRWEPGVALWDNMVATNWVGSNWFHSFQNRFL